MPSGLFAKLLLTFGPLVGSKMPNAELLDPRHTCVLYGPTPLNGVAVVVAMAQYE